MKIEFKYNKKSICISLTVQLLLFACGENITESEYAFFGFLTENEKAVSINSWSRETMKDCQLPDESLHFAIEGAGIWADAVRERRTLTLNDYNVDHPGKKGIPGGHVSLTRLMVVPLISLKLLKFWAVPLILIFKFPPYSPKYRDSSDRVAVNPNDRLTLFRPISWPLCPAVPPLETDAKPSLVEVPLLHSNG